MSDTLNILHLRKEMFHVDSVEYNESLFREQNIKKQLLEQGITDYKVWDGIMVKNMPFLGINLAMKMIVKDAKVRGLKSVVLAEDDINFSCPTSWQHFLETQPQDYDLFMGCPFQCEIDESNMVTFGFSGMTILRVHERFYDTFLSMKEMNNIDRELGRFAYKYKYIASNPFIAEQLGGYSYHQKKHIPDYNHLLDGRRLYGR